MEQKKYRVSVLMPCLNEEKTVGMCVENARRFLDENAIDGEVLVIDNAGTDASARIAEGAGAKVVYAPVRGYGAALSVGMKAARYECILMLDADASYAISEGMVFLDRLEDGCDLVVGNRFRGGIEKGAMPWLHRYIGNPVLSALGRQWSLTSIGDFHCGMRAFRKEKIEGLCLQATQMEFASEMIMKAAKEGLKLAEVPCKLYRDGRGGRSHLRTLRDGCRHLVCMWENRR